MSALILSFLWFKISDSLGVIKNLRTINVNPKVNINQKIKLGYVLTSSWGIPALSLLAEKALNEENKQKE